MRLYGRPEKRPMPKSFADDSPSDSKRLITDYFSLNRENLHPAPSRTEKILSRPTPSCDQRPQQTFLDLGQRDFIFRECKECGMKYDSSFSSDVRLHQRYHKFNTTGMTVKYDKTDVIGRWGEYTVFSVTKQRREEIMELVNNELNAVDLHGDESVYCLVDKESKLCSVAIIEPHIVELRISRIWTRRDKRRLGLARQLIHQVLCLEHKEKRDLRFSSPTTAGAAFAKSFIGDEYNNSYIYSSDR